jgi:hypothetical protein
VTIMQNISSSIKKSSLFLLLSALSVVSLGGCSGDGPAIQAHPQTLSFTTAPTLALGGSASVTASASSGLPVSYSSTTPTVCSVDSFTGIVNGLSTGTCTIAANQSGNTQYAPAVQVTQSLSVVSSPNQSISFAAAPALSLGGTASVSATASSGLPVSYSSITSAVCAVDASSGLVTDLAAGACIIAADQAGGAQVNPAPQATQTLTVITPSGISAPGAPTGVSASAGATANTVRVSIGGTNSGGSPITGYSVTSRPAGISAGGSASPITVSCPTSCAGYAFSVTASNASGAGAASVFADVITSYDVVETFLEPDTQPKNSMFVGSFTLNSTTGTVSNLKGILSESMTGGSFAYPNDNMTWLPLNNQLSSLPVTVGGVDGLLVTAFLLNTTNTLSANPAFSGSDGWSPGTGFGLYYGFPGPNPGNAYARVFVNLKDPTAVLTQAQIDKLAYADCTPGGMMGSTCMIGTTVAGYGALGTMSGYPVSQTVTRR